MCKGTFELNGKKELLRPSMRNLLKISDLDKAQLLSEVNKKVSYIFIII